MPNLVQIGRTVQKLFYFWNISVYTHRTHRLVPATTVEEFNNACSLFEVLCIRENVLFIEDERVCFEKKDLDSIIKSLSSSY